MEMLGDQSHETRRSPRYSPRRREIFYRRNRNDLGRRFSGPKTNCRQTQGSRHKENSMSDRPPIPIYSRFETELQVRPDDIDMNKHVHNSRYFDYVLAARYDQMTRCYRMSMEEFIKAGYSWVVKTAHLEYKRSLGLADSIIVRTWVEEIFRDGVTVHF